MNKVVIRRNYPVDSLPADIRAELGDALVVELRVTAAEPKGGFSITELVGIGPNVHGSEAETLAHIREGRDDDRG